MQIPIPNFYLLDFLFTPAIPPIAPVSSIDVNLTSDKVVISPLNIIKPDTKIITNIKKPDIIPSNKPLLFIILELIYPLINAPNALVAIVKGEITDDGKFLDFTNKNEEIINTIIEIKIPIIVLIRIALIDFSMLFSNDIVLSDLN